MGKCHQENGGEQSRFDDSRQGNGRHHLFYNPTPQKERIHLDVGNEAIRSLYQTFTGLRISTVYSFLQGSKVYFSILVYDIYNTLQYKIVMCALT